jgi:hypothetical protein
LKFIKYYRNLVPSTLFFKLPDMQADKKFFLLILPVFIAAFSHAQTITTKKDNARVKGENLPGHQTTLEGTMEEISNSFLRYLKTFGKVKQASDGITISEPTIGGTLFTAPLYALVKDHGNSASAWVGIKAADWQPEDAERMNKELEKLIYNFGVKYYQDKIQVQIDEALRAVQAVEKQQQRLVNEDKSLHTKLENNKKEKIQLEQALIKNKTEHETLLNKIDQNKQAQDSVAVAAEQIRKAVEMHRERQRKVQ